MEEVSNRINQSLGADRLQVQSLEVTELFTLSHPCPSETEIAAGVRVNLINGAKFELVVSEFIGWVSKEREGKNGFYVVMSEPRHGTTMKGHVTLSAVDLPDAEKKFIEIIRRALQAAA